MERNTGERSDEGTTGKTLSMHWLFLRCWPILLLQQVCFKTSGKKKIQYTHLCLYFITPSTCASLFQLQYTYLKSILVIFFLLHRSYTLATRTYTKRYILWRFIHL